MTRSKHSLDISLCLDDLVEAGAPLAGEEEDTEAGEADTEEEEGESPVSQDSHHIVVILISPGQVETADTTPCY